jgi:peptide/nickel transport system substrate-binding protein
MTRTAASSPRRFLRASGLALMVTSLLLGLAACGSSGGGDSSATATVKADVLTVTDTGQVVTLDPRASSSTEARMLANFYEPLILANPPGSPEPYSPVLATSWEKSADGLVWTFHLREGVKFHDGTPFTAAAVKYSYDATKKLNQGYAYIWGDLKQVKVVDDFTVQLILKRSIPLEPLVSSMYAAWIFSPTTAGRSTKSWDQDSYVDGTGPYTLESYKPNQEIVMVRNPDYWGGWKDNQYQKVVLTVVAEANTARQMLESGQSDGMQIVPYDAVSAMESNPGIAVHELASLLSVPVQLNVLHKPLDNVKVRQALAYATPYDDIIAAAINGFGTQSNSILPPGLWPRNDDLPLYTYDLEKAKQLMSEAGYANGGVKLVMTYPVEEDYQKPLGELLKESWAKIGVELDIRPMVWAQAAQKAQGPDANRQDVLSATWWPAYAHGYDLMRTSLHSESPPLYNNSYWYNPEYDKLIDTAFVTESTDRPKAQAMYDQALQMVHDQVPMIFVWDFKSVTAWNSKLKFGPMAQNMFYPPVIRYYYVTL